LIRVVLDHELKREYQQFLHDRDRDHPDADGRPDRDPKEIEQWAQEQICRTSTATSLPDLRLNKSGPTVVAISKTSRSQRSTTAVRTPRPKLGPDHEVSRRWRPSR